MSSLKKELKFIHITKCAGTFIEELGNKHGLKWGRYHEEYGFWHDYFIYKPSSLKEKYDWFVIIRNPYDRILSEYYCKWGYGIGNTNIVHNKIQFNDFILNKIKNIVNCHYHYSEQYKYIDKNYNITIIKYENLSNELPELFKKYDLNIEVNFSEKVNSRENYNNSQPFNTSDFSNELIKYINEIYHEDFIIGNYEKIEI